jgi:hypothetical protein
MATISEAKRAANRENAKKSTGPKTAEGKERSRANAFKHGLTGEGVVKADDLKREIQKRVDEWSDALKPKTGLEKWLVERAAVDSARVDVAVECELARHAARSRTDAIYSSNDKLPALLAARIGRQLMSSQDEPGAPWLELRSTSAGCDWMINKWECIARRQEAQEGWSWSDFCHAERLIGESTRADTISRRLATLAADYLAQLEEDWKRDPESTLKEVGITHEELLNSLECSGWYPADLLSPEDVPGDADTRVRANDRLREFVADEIAELTARRDLLPEFEALDAGEASDRLLVDSSPEGVLLNRYEHELHRRVHQSLRELDRLQKARADEPDEAAAEPEPAPSRNEATAASRPAPLAASPPPVSNPFRDGGAAANGSMSLHTPFIAPPGHV